MAEKIYIMDGDGNLESMDETLFDQEDVLQELIANHPELLAGEQMDPDKPRRWILIRREKGIADRPGGGDRWSVDHLLIDQDAVPTLVEAKRSSNPEIRRRIVGQMLDYAAHAAGTWSVDEIRATFESFEPDPEGALAKLLEGTSNVEADAFWQDVERNLADRRLRLLFVADGIPDELARIVEFLNEQMPNIEVLAVEIKQFRGESNQALFPRVIGRLTTQHGRSGGRLRRNLTRDTFLGRFIENDVRQVAKRLLQLADNEPDASLEWGSSGVSVRMRCEQWNQPITVAWFYPVTGMVGWMRTQEFTFGAAIFEGYEPEPSEELRVCLENWIDEFENDGFSKRVFSRGVRAYAVSHADAVKEIELLECRIKSIFRQLKDL